MTPMGIRTGPLSFTDLSNIDFEDGLENEVDGDLINGDGGDGSELPSVSSNSSSLSDVIRKYHFTSSLPSLPPTVLVPSGRAVVAKNDFAISLYPCFGVEPLDTIWMGTRGNAERYKVITVPGRWEGETEKDPRCTARVDRKWKGHLEDENYAFEDVEWYKEEGRGEGVVFKEGSDGDNDGVRLDGRRILSAEGGDYFFDIELNGTSAGSWGKGEVIVSGQNKDDGTGRRTATFTTDRGDVELLAAEGAARIGVTGREGRMTGGVEVGSDGGVRIRDVKGNEVLSTAKDGHQLWISGDEIVVDSNITKMENSNLTFGRKGRVVGEEMEFEGKERITVMGSKVEVASDFVEFRPSTSSKDGIVDIRSTAGMKVGGKEKVVLWSDGKIELNGVKGLWVNGGALRVGEEGVESGGLKTNSTMTYLEGRIVVGGSDEMLVKNKGGLEVEGRRGGVESRVKLEGDKSGITVYNELDAEIVLSSPNRTGGIVSFQNSDDGKEKGRIEFWQGGEAGIRKGGGRKDEGDTSHFKVVVDGNERLRVDESGRLGLGEGGRDGDLKATLHLRGSGGKIKNTFEDVALLIEGKEGNVIGMVGGGEKKGHVNGLVMGETGGRGKPDFWVVSQRGSGGDRFEANSLIIGHSEEVTDIKGGGLDKLDFLEVGVALSKSGKVGIGVEKPRSAKLVVGGAVGAARYLLFSDAKFVKGKTELKGSDAISAARKVAVYKCRYDNTLDGAGAWRGMGGGEEYCMVAQEVEKVDKMLVEAGADGEKLVKVEGVLALVLRGVGEVGNNLEAMGERMEATEGDVESAKEDMVRMGKNVTKLKGEIDEVAEEGRELREELSVVKGGLREIRAEVEMLKGDTATDAVLRSGLNNTVWGFVSLLNIANQRIKEVSEQVAKLQEEGRKFEERSAKGGGQDDNADRNFFLEEVNRLQREFMDSQDIPVKDTQLKALRTKWRNEAYEALKQRKEDKNFFERQT